MPFLIERSTQAAPRVQPEAPRRGRPKPTVVAEPLGTQVPPPSSPLMEESRPTGTHHPSATANPTSRDASGSAPASQPLHTRDPATSPPPPAPPATRDRILEAARDLFWRKGYHATGIAEILAAADARSGSLYHFFPTKEDLLVAVLDRYKELLWPAVIQPVFDRLSDPIERVFGILDGYRRMLQITECSKGCPIGNLALELSDTHPTARALIAENFTNWRAAVQRCLDDAADRLPLGTDRTQLAAFVLIVMEGGLMQAKAYRSIEPFEAGVAQLREHFEHLLASGTNWSAPRPRPADAQPPQASDKVPLTP